MDLPDPVIRPRPIQRRWTVVLTALLAVAAAACEPAGSPLEPHGPSGPVEPPVDPPSPGPGSGKLEPPAGRIVHGMGQWDTYNAKLLAALPTAVRPVSELVFVTLGDTPRGWEPGKLAALLQGQVQAGLIPHVDIALRGLQPGHAELAAMADKLYGIDDEVASGTRYDDRIRDLATVVGALASPVVVRIGGEFNGAWNGYHPHAYPVAFRKIVQMFRDAGVGNAVFVWCYEPAAPGDFDAVGADGAYKWYPGEDVIDWYAIDWFDTDDFTGPLTDRGVETRHGRTRRFLDMAVAEGKRVMVAESSPARFDLADPAQAEAAWQEWFLPYFAILAERTEIGWFHLISYDWAQASYYQEIGWRNNDLTADAKLLGRLIQELSKPMYLNAPDAGLLR